jgi:hypothetical protein
MGFGYTLAMRSADLTKKQRAELERRKELVDWLQGGFNEYADLVGRRGPELMAGRLSPLKFVGTCYSPAEIIRSAYQGEIHDHIRIQIKQYAEEFGRVLRSKGGMSDKDDPLDLLRVRSDLYDLMKSGCPAVALVELMLACTSDYGVTVPDLLLRVLLLSDYLDRNLNHFRIPRRRYEGLVPRSIRFMLEIEPYCAAFCGTMGEERDKTPEWLST